MGGRAPAQLERGGPQADAAWSRVVAGVTNLDSWKNGFATEPRYGRYPRNKP